MKCVNCGANLLDTDQFCSKCGAKVTRTRRCPDCGAVLRDGTKFCHECGRLVEDGAESSVSQETLDIPIEVIERNILSETAAEMRSDKRAPAKRRAPEERSAEHRRAPEERSAEHRRAPEERSPEHRRAPEERSPEHRRAPEERSAERRHSPEERAAAPKKKSAAPAPVKKKASPAPPPKKKRPVYEEEDWEEEDWDEDDWDDEDEDDDEGPDVFGIMTAVVGCVILFVAAFIAFQLYRQYVPKNYDKAAERQEEDGEDAEQEEPEDSEMYGESQQASQGAQGDIIGEIRIVSNVNVRDYPSTEGSNVLRVAKEGEIYQYYGIVESNWVEVLLEDGSTGYLHKDYMEIVD